MNLVEEVRYVMSNVAGNNNKFWYGYRYDNHLVRSENGRVGTTGDSHEFPQDSEDEAKKFLAKKCKEKEKKGYRKIDVVSGGSPKNPTVTISQSVNLIEVAKKQIESNSPETTALIERLSKANIHNILSSTTMTYNVATGLFSTPCGILGQSTIDSARDLLKDLGVYVIKGDLLNQKYIKLLEEYLMLIPTKIPGRRLDPETLFTTDKDINKQSDILDSLEASLQSVLNTPITESENKDIEQKVFSVKLFKVEDEKTIDRIKKKIHSTMDRNHASSHLRVKTIYSVDIETMRTKFEKQKDKISNVSEMFHGTRVHNILSILKGGLTIPKSNASHVTGRLYGDGAYFSPTKSSKSLNYSMGYWDGKARDQFCFLFLADVSMGSSYIPTGKYDGSYPKSGYDSVWAKEGKSGVINDECIVYNTNQCNLTYLVEFSPDGK